jgi:hypothetical protein
LRNGFPSPPTAASWNSPPISPADVRCLWQRHDLTSIKHRLKALDAKVTQDGILLAEAQIAALDKGQSRQGSAWRVRQRMPRLLRRPGNLLCRYLKGVGRVYRQTVIDTYAKVAFAKLYDRNTPITAVEILNDRVVPFYDEHGILLSRMLSDRGTEFCGSQSHEYELYPAVLLLRRPCAPLAPLGANLPQNGCSRLRPAQTQCRSWSRWLLMLKHRLLQI